MEENRKGLESNKDCECRSLSLSSLDYLQPCFESKHGFLLRLTKCYLFYQKTFLPPFSPFIYFCNHHQRLNKYEVYSLYSQTHCTRRKNG